MIPFLKVKSGVVINLITVLILQLSLNTYGMGVFDLGEYPDWARPLNETLGAVNGVVNGVGVSPTLNATMLLNATMTPPTSYS